MPTVLDSLNRGLHQAFAEDAHVFLIGEDVLDPYGGAFKVTKGLSNQYPDRVWTSPVSEAAIVGVAAGMALAFAFSAERGLCPRQDAERVAAHLRAVGLPDGLAAAGITASGVRLVEHMLHDKKMEAGTLPFLLARGIGETYLDKTVDLNAVAAFLDAQR